jgi:hypothetical protein
VIDRPRLVALPGHGDRSRPDVQFCGHCGRPPDVVNSHIGDLLVPADIEIAGPESLVNLIVHAARGTGETHHVVLRPAKEFGIRFWARIAPCGPPRAALVVLADGRA